MNIVITDVDWDSDSDGIEVVSENLLPILIVGCNDNGELNLCDYDIGIVGDMISDATGWCHKDWTFRIVEDVTQETLDNVKKILVYDGPDIDEDPLNEPREYTEEEVRDRFLDHIAYMVQYWIDEDRTPKLEDKMTGLVHSILVTLDGGSYLPGFTIVPSPHPSDKEYHKLNGENWFPNNGDIGGYLHELWNKAVERVKVKKDNKLTPDFV